MKEYIDSLGEETVFSTLEDNSDYRRVVIKTKDRGKTTFTFFHGPYIFLNIPFGLKNAPGAFQRTIDVILASVI